MLKIRHESIGTTYGDGTYDTKAILEPCRQLKIDPVFKIRENASNNANGSMFRKDFVDEYRKLVIKNGVRKISMEIVALHRNRIFSCKKDKWRTC